MFEAEEKLTSCCLDLYIYMARKAEPRAASSVIQLRCRASGPETRSRPLGENTIKHGTNKTNHCQKIIIDIVLYCHIDGH